MTETEWLTCNSLGSMLSVLTGKASDRKQRLFAIAACRQIWDLLFDERSRHAVSTAESMADNEATAVELEQANKAANDASRDALYVRRSSAVPAAAAARAVLSESRIGSWDDPNRQYSLLACIDGCVNSAATARHFDQITGHPEIESNDLVILFRDIFGNPFRPVTIDPAWLAWNDGTVRNLTQAIYDDRELPSGHLDAARLAILADALEEAGCTNADILGHCRSAGRHVRGCWVVDLLLGKE